MCPEQAGEIQLIVSEDYAGSRRRKLDVVTERIAVDDLRDRFKEFMGSLQAIVDVEEADGGNFRLTEIQFSAEISASGEFKLIGTGVGVEASSAVTFVLQRQRSGV